jgi:signal transduction histidine kinase
LPRFPSLSAAIPFPARLIGIAGVDWAAADDGDAVAGPLAGLSASFAHAQLAVGVVIGALTMSVVYLIVDRLRRPEPEGKIAVAVLRERRRIAQELHDVVGHGLLVVAMCARQLAAGTPDVRTLAHTIDQTVQQTLYEMRQAIGMLRGATAMDTHDSWLLSTRVAALIARIPGPDPPVHLDISGLETELSSPLRTTALRVVQEGLTNALKHDGTRTIRVELEFGDDLVVRVVTGHGRKLVRGPAAVADGDRYGLAGLRERVAGHNGVFGYGPLEGGGFLVEARLPRDAGPEHG